MTGWTCERGVLPVPMTVTAADVNRDDVFTVESQPPDCLGREHQHFSQNYDFGQRREDDENEGLTAAPELLQHMAKSLCHLS